MKDFNNKEEEFFRKIGDLEAELGLPPLDIKLYQLPEPGIKLPANIDREVARKIARICNEVFS